SALDYEMTLFMREQLQRIFLETGTTTVLVSHDLEEAVYLADRILLLSRQPLRCGVRAREGALPRHLPARGATAMKRLEPLLPVVGVIGLIVVWYIAV